MLMHIVYFCPISALPSGGIKVIYGHAEILASQGISCSVFHPENPSYSSSWFEHQVKRLMPARKQSIQSRLRGIHPCCAADQLDAQKDFAVIPEVWAGALGQQCIDLGVHFAIFVQGGYIMMNGRWPGSLEQLEKTYQQADLILSISEDTTRMIKLAYPSLDAKKILQVAPVIGGGFFEQAKVVSEQKELPEQKKCITYMNRRLPEHADKVRFFLKPYLPADWRLTLIDGMHEAQVMQTLSESSIFLSFCDLEGFGLPPLEAALCGNVVVGYTGQGAQEYFSSPVFHTIAHGDLHAFVVAIRATITKLSQGDFHNPAFFEQLAQIKHRYSPAQQLQSLVTFAQRASKALQR